MKIKSDSTHIFGPVPSRRLGKSLGIDIVPYKTCTLDCIYCECGKTTDLTIKRKSYLNADIILGQLRKKLKENKDIDCITFSGSGEPTLNLDIGKIIRKIKKMTSIPVVVLTNGTLLYDKKVRTDLMAADIVIPSLDAVTPGIFHSINRGNKRLDISRVVSGLKKFRKEYKGKIWLEILVVKGINDSEAEIKKIAAAANSISPDRIQLNTCIRPGTIRGLRSLSYKELLQYKKYFEMPVDIFAGEIPRLRSVERSHPFLLKGELVKKGIVSVSVIEMLKRRPCTIRDLASASNSSAGVIAEKIRSLKESGIKVEYRVRNGYKYYYIGKRG